MAEEMEQKVRRLLRPTHDVAGWHDEVARLDPDAAIPVLAAIMNNPGEDVQTRSQAATLLGALHDARAHDALLQARSAADALVRARAALALGQLGLTDPLAVQSLIEGLSDEDYFVRESCTRVLGMLKRIEALPALEQVRASDSIATNREAAEAAIRSIREDPIA